jgi:hypothetical protein
MDGSMGREVHMEVHLHGKIHQQGYSRLWLRSYQCQQRLGSPSQQTGARPLSKVAKRIAASHALQFSFLR